MVFAVTGMLIMLKNGLEAGNIIGNLGALATDYKFLNYACFISGKVKKMMFLGGTFFRVTFVLRFCITHCRFIEQEYSNFI